MYKIQVIEYIYLKKKKMRKASDEPLLTHFTQFTLSYLKLFVLIYSR